MKHMKKFDFNKASTDSDIILAPVINDFGNMLCISKLLKKITDEKNLNVKYFHVSTSIDDTFISYTKIKYIFKRLLSVNRFTLNKIRKINHINKNDIIFSNYFLFNQNIKFQLNFNSKDDVLNLNYSHIRIGDLIYDHYLRFRNEATIDIKDKYLHHLVKYAKILTEKWSYFLENNNIKIIILPYTSYLHWGIATRVALKKNITIYTYSANNFIINQIDISYPFHTKNFHKYIEYFNRMIDQNKKLELSDKRIRERLSGKIDNTTSYMLNSPYGDNLDFIPLVFENKSTIIFLHCFFDSPHIYGDGLFVDFYEWINYILTVASENVNIIYYVKPHPNGLPENKRIIDFFRNKFEIFKNIIFLNPKISNKQLLNMKPSSIFTFYGTVAHEFAYMGIPVITAGDNPHSKFNFLYNPETLDHLKFFILNVGEYGLPHLYKKNDILIFYYMHYLYYNKKLDASNYNNVKNIQHGEFEISPEFKIEDLIYN